MEGRTNETTRKAELPQLEVVHTRDQQRRRSQPTLVSAREHYRAQREVSHPGTLPPTTMKVVLPHSLFFPFTPT